MQIKFPNEKAKHPSKEGYDEQSPATCAFCNCSAIEKVLQLAHSLSHFIWICTIYLKQKHWWKLLNVTEANILIYLFQEGLMFYKSHSAE